MSRSYQIFDVFTDRKLAGNPLAIVFDADGLDGAAMQSVAAEFNLSETVFLMPPNNPAHSAQVRIFTPLRELPFAGHPTIGAAIALARNRFADNGTITNGEQDVLIVLEEVAGLVRCGVRLFKDRGFAEFDGPVLPQTYPMDPEKDEIAAACGLSSADIGFENHVPGRWSAGVPFTMVPVHNRAALADVTAIQPLWKDVFGDDGVYFYCRDPEGHTHHFRSRMLDPEAGISEDPGTGSAVAALAGAVYHYDDLPDGEHSFIVEQGFEMGRPSLIHLEIIAEHGKLSALRIGGNAVCVASGEIDI